MIKKIKISFSEKILLIFLILIGIFSFSFFFIIKNKCFFVEDVNPGKIQFTNRQNIANKDSILFNKIEFIKNGIKKLKF